MIFVGISDAGKSFVSKFLLSPWYDYEVGNCNVPLNDACASNFWLQTLPGSEVYKIEELYITGPVIFQSLKTLFEGNKNLQAEIKYKTPVSVPRRPVIYTSNANSGNDLLKFVGSAYEIEALHNRACIYQMKKNIDHRYDDGNLDLMMEHSRTILKALFKKYGSAKTSKQETYCVDIISKNNEM